MASYIAEFFRTFDINDDGEIDKKEFENALRDLLDKNLKRGDVRGTYTCLFSNLHMHVV